MNAEILPNGDLRISVDAEERARIKAWWEEEHSEDLTCDPMATSEVLEPLTACTDYQLVEPVWCGVSTDAPVIGIFGEARPLQTGENMDNLKFVSQWDDKIWVEDVTDAWEHSGWPYTNPLDDLIDCGETIFTRILLAC